MKIAICGDSFADPNGEDAGWWIRLQHQYGHDIEVFGCAGSSIMYSADIIRHCWQQFDFVIWCFTTPGRFSIRLPGSEKFIHSVPTLDTQGNRYAKVHNDIEPFIQACQNYLKYIFDPVAENLLGQAVAEYFLKHVPNLMIIPCFYDPLEKYFHLFGVSQREISAVVNSENLDNVDKKYIDIRSNHLTKLNRQRLADLVASQLVPGIFQASYDDFDFSGITFSEILRPI